MLQLGAGNRRVGLAALALLLAGSLSSGCATIRLTEENIYVPQPGAALTAEALAARTSAYTFQPQTVTAPDGTRLAGALLRRPGADRTILYFGGNLFTVEKRGAALARVLEPLGANLMVVDYRGYGASGAGNMQMDAVMSDALAAFDHLAALPGIDPRQIVVHGQSLGSFMAGHVAAQRPTAGVVLESSATTAEAFARLQVPLFARPFVRLDIAESLRRQGNLQQMSRLDEPLLVLVGSEDDVTPASFSRNLFRASTLPAAGKRLLVVKGAGHNNVLADPSAITAYREFLALAR